MADIAKDAIQQVAGEEKVVEIAGAQPAPNPFSSEDAELAELEKQAAAAEGKSEKPAEAKPEAQKETLKDAPKDELEKAAATSNTAEQGAIIALRKRTQELAAQNLVLQGQVQAFQGIVKPAEAKEEEVKADTIDDIDAQYLEIAKLVDAGTKSEVDAEAERLELRKRERAILKAEQERLLADQAPQPANDLGLQEHVNQLVTSYPILNKLTEEQLAPFEQLAYEQAQLEGKPIQEGPLGTKELRNRMAVLAESFYDPKAAAARVKPAEKQEAGLSDVAKAREAKLAMAAEMPPDIGKIGAGATGGDVTEEQAESTLKAFGGNEDAQLKWLEQHPQFVSKVMGRSMRLTR